MKWTPMTRQELEKQVDRIVVKTLADQQAFTAGTSLGDLPPTEPDSEEVTEKILEVFAEFSPFDLVLARKE